MLFPSRQTLEGIASPATPSSIILAMDWLVDEIILLALCLPLALAEPLSANAVVGVLAAIVVTSVAELASSKWARLSALSAYLVGAVFFSSLAVMLPMVAYQCVRQPYPAFRAAWLVAVFGSYLVLGVSPALPSLLLCTVATVLSVRTARNAAERRVLRLARDGVREQLLDAKCISDNSQDLVACADDECELCDAVEEAAGRLGMQAALSLQDASSTAPVSASSLINCLTEREQAIAGLVAEGLDNKEIAAELYLGEGTVRNHISSILQKCHLKNRTQVAIMYLRETL